MGAPELPGALETVMSLGSGYGVLGCNLSSGLLKEYSIGVQALTQEPSCPDS